MARCQSASRLFSLQGNFLALLCCNVFKLCHSVLSFQAFLQRSVGNARQNFVACLFAASVVGFDATVGNTRMEQRINLKFLVKLRKSPTECFKLLTEVYGEDEMSRPRVFKWHKRFKSGREEVEDDPRSGRPSTTKTDKNIVRVKQMVRSDRRLTIRMIADNLDLNRESVRSILLHDLGMRKVCAKLVPKILSEDQKQRRVDFCKDMLEKIRDDPNILYQVITGDETWVFQYDPETKRQSMQWKTAGSPRPKKARMSKSKIKVMLIAFFDQKGLVHHEFVPEGETVNQYFY